MSDIVIFQRVKKSSITNNFSNYNLHKKGRVILGAPGIGKTTWVQKTQKPDKNGKRDWVDGDYLMSGRGFNTYYGEAKKFPPSSPEFELAYKRCDYAMEAARNMGFKLILALCWEYVPDAVVILPEKQHAEQIKGRKDLNINTVKTINTYFKKMAAEYKVPIFDNIPDAVKYCDNL